MEVDSQSDDEEYFSADSDPEVIFIVFIIKLSIFRILLTMTLAVGKDRHETLTRKYAGCKM